MIRLLQHLLDPAYLYAVNPGPLGRWGAVYVVWATLLLVGGTVALWLQRRNRSGTLKTLVIACGVGIAFLALRLVSPHIHNIYPHTHFLLLDAWTARVWPISATLIALIAACFWGARQICLPPDLRQYINVLTGPHSLDAPAPPAWLTVLLVVFHLAGLAWLWHSAGHSPWWAVPSFAALLLLPLLTTPHRLRLETATPLFLSYAGSFICFVLSKKLNINIQEYQGFALPDPWSPWFNAPVLVMAGVIYTLWLQLRLCTSRWPQTVRQSGLPILILTLTAIWLVATATIHHTFGVTASDPYCYVQMAIDLAQTGTALHNFPLAGVARGLGLPTWPTVHVGYQPPFFENLSPTMWPVGWPALMAPLYWLGGLDTLYLAAPLMAALALCVTWFLVNETLISEPGAVRRAAAALTCFLVATSPEGAERMLVPMADAAAQLFTLLTLWLLIKAMRIHPLRYGLLAGLSMGMAFFIRHPQLPLLLAALVAAWLIPAHPRRKLAVLTLFGLAALAVTIPDLAYHQTVFGGWLHTESTESSLLSFKHLGSSLLSILQQGLGRREELGFIWPFVAYGGVQLWKRHRRPTAILLSGFAAVFIFHLCYAALRPRDLIAILPILYLAAAYGFVVVWQRIQARTCISAAFLLWCCLLGLLARSQRTLELPWRDDVITFGYVSRTQYQNLLKLKEITPSNAVIGSMLNGGAIELYAQRRSVHPTPWSDQELVRWCDELAVQQMPFYVLDDGEEMASILSRLEQYYQVQPVTSLELPYFAVGGGNLPRLAWLYQISQK